jgi:hypothetical protein
MTWKLSIARPGEHAVTAAAASNAVSVKAKVVVPKPRMGTTLAGNRGLTRIFQLFQRSRLDLAGGARRLTGR